MDPLTTAAAGGLRARMESLDMLANNIANASTSGYKVDREFYSLFVDEGALAGSPDPLNSILPVVEKPWTDFTQGNLQVTSNPLDLALSGKGFFAVNGPSGTMYTRSGAFQSGVDGIVTTAEGYPVRLTGGAPLRVVSNRPFDVSADGTIRQNGAVVGTLEIVNLPETGVTKQGASYFRLNDPKATTTPARAEVQQGKLENSNVSTPETAVRLIGIMRQFETLQKAIGIGGEMNRRAIEEVARITS